MSIEEAEHYQSQSEGVTKVGQKIQNQTWVIMGTDLLEINYAEKHLGILYQHQIKQESATYSCSKGDQSYPGLY